MIQFIPQREAVGITRIFDIPAIEASKVWVCTDCGAKVLHCKAVVRPQYQCLCGAQKWKQSVKRHKIR